MKEFEEILKFLGPEATLAALHLLKDAVSGSDSQSLALRAEHLAHCIAFEKALHLARQ